jgi:uncharacterized membrane protein required for colicin V production
MLIAINLFPAMEFYREYSQLYFNWIGQSNIIASINAIHILLIKQSLVLICD